MRRRRPHSDLPRRDVLLGAGALTLLGCPPPKPMPDAGPPSIDPQAFDHATRVAFRPAPIPEALATFPQGVAAGLMAKDGVTLWVRAEGKATVKLRVWRDVGSDTEVALIAEHDLALPDEGSAKVRVDGLAPATWYSYACFTPDLASRSVIGRVRTAYPDDWKEPLTFGVTSCAKFINAPFRALSLQAKQAIDFWLHLGDVSYNDGAVSLEDFRAKWHQTLGDPGYRDLRAATGGYLTWDDHDFWNNFDPEALGPTNAQFLAAKQAYLEALPTELLDGHLWRSVRWGRTAELFLIDSRLERLPSTRLTPQAQYLSRAQLDWLKSGLVDSPCHFKLVATSVPITNMPPPSWGGQSDRWQGYPAPREELLGHLIEHAVDNVWFLGGDFHLGLVMRVEKSGPYSRFVEIAGGPAGNGSPFALLFEPGQEVNREIAFPSTQFLFASGGFNATTITVDPAANTLRVVFQNSATRETTYDQALTFGD